MTLDLRRLSYALGAEVCDINVGKPMSESTFGEIHRAFLDHGILLFRDQNITREQHIDFSRRFGELDRHDSLPRDRHPQYPELLMVTNEPKPDGKPGDGIHVGKRKIVDLTPEREAESKRLNPPIAQPVVRVHPETGRKALYIGEKVECFVGMTPEESKPIIDFLIRHATQPRFTYRHQWRAHDIVIWDNRCTMHAALGDYEDSEPRHLERTTVMGTPSGSVIQGDAFAVST